jgi:alpha/beta superfamily hydrolase/putative sterol carrier protein
MTIVDAYFNDYLGGKIGRPLAGIPASYAADFHIHLADEKRTWRVVIAGGQLVSVAELPGKPKKGLCFVLEVPVLLALAAAKLGTTEAFFARKISIENGLFEGMRVGETLARIFAAEPWTAAAVAAATQHHIPAPVESMPLEDIFEETLRIEAGPGIDLCAAVACPETGTPAMAVFIFPPDPTLGGGLSNNVVQALHRNAARAGLLSVKVGYRGMAGGTIAGRGVLEYWEELRKTGDLSVIADDGEALIARVCREFNIGAIPSAYIGYSFGAYAALQLLERRPASFCAAISPPLDGYPFAQLKPPHQARILFIAGSHDEFCPATELADLAKKFGAEVAESGSDDHFHRGVEDVLADRIVRAALAEGTKAQRGKGTKGYAN